MNAHRTLEHDAQIEFTFAGERWLAIVKDGAVSFMTETGRSEWAEVSASAIVAQVLFSVLLLTCQDVELERPDDDAGLRQLLADVDI